MDAKSIRNWLSMLECDERLRMICAERCKDLVDSASPFLEVSSPTTESRQRIRTPYLLDMSLPEERGFATFLPVERGIQPVCEEQTTPSKPRREATILSPRITDSHLLAAPPVKKRSEAKHVQIKGRRGHSPRPLHFLHLYFGVAQDLEA